MLALAAELRGRFRLSFGCVPNEPGHALLARVDSLGVESLPLDGRGPIDGSEIERLGRWLRETEVDVFHLHAGVGWEGHTATQAARAAGVPVVIRTEHLPDVLRPDERESHRRLMEVVDSVICVSAGARATYVESGIPSEKIHVIRNGIALPVPASPRRLARQSLGLPLDLPIALTVARFTEQKGHRLLLEALPEVLARCPTARFLWAGDGSLQDELRDQAKGLGVADTVHFLGRREDVPVLMAGADLFVLPSLFEGLPLVVLEAMASGLPVVATRVVGIVEVVADGVTGRLVEAGDAAGLTAAIVETLTRPDLAARWGAAGRKRVEREFSAARMARETAAVYEDLLDRPQTTTHSGAHR